MEEAIPFITDRREQLRKARAVARQERRTKNNLVKTSNSKWINPRSLHFLTEMGFDKDVCAIALQKSDNELNQAVRVNTFFSIKCCEILIIKIILFQVLLLQQNQSALRDELEKSIKPDESLCQQIITMGFDAELIRKILKETGNDMQKTIEDLLKMQTDGTYECTLSDVRERILAQSQSNATGHPSAADQPSTSSTTAEQLAKAAQDRADEQEVSHIF